MSEHADEVDRLVEAWARERPDLDVQPMQVVSRVSRLARKVERLRRSAFAVAGLESWEFDVLSALRRRGSPYEMSPTALVEETMVTSGTMTNRIDRLVARGLVERRTDETDRRVVRVAMTPRGRKHVDAAIEALLAAERLILDRLPEPQRKALEDSLRLLGEGFSAP